MLAWLNDFIVAVLDGAELWWGRLHCERCGGTGFDLTAISPNLGPYDRICDDCGGQSAARFGPPFDYMKDHPPRYCIMLVHREGGGASCQGWSLAEVKRRAHAKCLQHPGAYVGCTLPYLCKRLGDRFWDTSVPPDFLGSDLFVVYKNAGKR